MLPAAIAPSDHALERQSLLGSAVLCLAGAAWRCVLLEGGPRSRPFSLAASTSGVRRNKPEFSISTASGCDRTVLLRVNVGP